MDCYAWARLWVEEQLLYSPIVPLFIPIVTRIVKSWITVRSDSPAKLVYNPLVVKEDSSVIETRIISLDKGSQLNKTVVSFDNLQETLRW